ncbi:hypothetical protein [Thiorhodovibrio winogradskyi]|nr:hypothetical protein [Thiorhodovibrio winogradskyi]
MLAVASSANALLIDDFSDDQEVTALSSTEFSDLAATSGSGFIGTNRRITVSNTAGETTAKVNLLQPGFLDLQNSTTASGIIEYSGPQF